MPSLSFGLILTELNKLTPYELKQLYTVIEDKAVSLAKITAISDQAKESKFTKDVVYPYCGYIQFAKNMGVHLIQIEHGKTKQDIYHIQHINAYHSTLKNWIRHFKGISTKRLDNYLNWFKWLKLNKDKRDYEKVKALLINTVSTQMNIKNCDFWNQRIKKCYLYNAKKFSYIEGVASISFINISKGVIVWIDGD
ncbi:hypothetical protein [Niameybacter sp.]|uniref:hypothetical protein n=1 Tax=Niameybacter sp. TaxID=2033640 RepID=UPI002FCB1524